jgi:putative SOS response-associated peptidase YedK
MQNAYVPNMCARYSLTKEDMKILIGGNAILLDMEARYNIAPGQRIPVIVPDVMHQYVVTDMAWGWPVSKSKPLLARTPGEQIHDKTPFKKYLAQRCLIPADGFYEFTGRGKYKTPVRFTKPKDEPFCMAGLFYETASAVGETEVAEHSCLVLTTAPNLSVARFHSSMPLIVQPAHYSWWLGSDDMYKLVIQHPDREELIFRPVQKTLIDANAEGPHLLGPMMIQPDLL